MKQYRKTYVGLGFIFGLAIPCADLFLRGYFSGRTDVAWFREELSDHLPYYSYAFVIMPVIFIALGYFLGYLRNKVSGLQKTQESLEAIYRGQTVTDEVTGLYHRTHLLAEVERELERAIRYKRHLSIMVIDLDGFTSVNNKYGKKLGDYVLKEVAAILKKDVRAIDILGRYGSDEYMVILPESARETTQVVAERIQKEIAEHQFITSEGPLVLSVSIGISTYRDPDESDRRTLVIRVDKALQEAKKQGRNGIVFI